jgi:DNA-binding CsgD family transcriptional regulator
MDLVGREVETNAIEDILRAAREGLSGTLVVRGEAGIGKTAVLNWAEKNADDFHILKVDGVESEQSMSFAGLHRLLVPLLGGSDDLPVRQRDALDTAFGRLGGGGSPDLFLIGLAALTLLADAATRRPLLCVIDDAQWMDEESRELLAFIARRLHAERIVLLIAVRDGEEVRDSFHGLPEMRLPSLALADARRLLFSVADQPLDVVLAARILTESQGNPLALVELREEALTGERAAGLLPGEPLPLGRRLEALFRHRVEALPESTRAFLLIAAAEPVHLDLVWKAAERMGIPVQAVEAATAARLFDPRRDPAFVHPLARSAAYGSASPSDRRRVHEILAELIGAGEPEARARHRSAATPGIDEDVAAELEEVASHAEGRGGWSARAAFLVRAAELTPEPSRRSDRLLTAAEASLVSGSSATATALLERSRIDRLTPRQSAQAKRIEAALATLEEPGRVPVILLEAAQALESLDPLAARDSYREALQACMVSCQLTTGTTPREVGSAALEAAHLWGSKRREHDALQDGLAARFAVGYAAAVPDLQRGLAALCTESAPSAGMTRWAVLGANAAAELWDADGYRTVTTLMEKTDRQRGALDSLRLSLGPVAHALMWAGDFTGADVAHSEATEISVALGADAATWEALKVELLAWQGRDEEARFVAELLTGELGQSTGAGVVVNLGHVALGILDIAHGRYEDALAHGLVVMEADSCPHGSQILPEVVEAGVRSGDMESAGAAFRRMRYRASASQTPWALGLLARCEALISTDPETHYERSLDLLRTTYVKTDLARTHLLFGEWLRRNKRRSEARDQLRAAYELFDGMGATAFAERTRVELAATGERARRRDVATDIELTAQERQIAGLAAYGATNQEIAGQLFLSSATVDYHLRKVFRKLSISSRRQLAAHL